MASSPEFAAHCVELLQPLGLTRSRRMFGGHGFYVDGIFIAIASRDRLYLKTDATTRPRFEAAGCEPFVYHGGNGEEVMLGYWTPPDEALESPMLMHPWARLAMEAALRARNAKPARKTGAKKAPAKKAPAKASPARALARKTSAARQKP